MPITRSRGNPVTCFVTQHITSSGFETTRTIASGQWRLISCETCFTLSALVRTRSSRLIPGLRAMPAVTTTRALPAAGPQSFAPTTRVSKPSIGADSHWSSPLPWGTPSITSTRTTRRASSFSARRWAAVAPTLPAPTTVILLIMGSKATDSFPLSTTWRGGQGVRPPVGVSCGQPTADGVRLEARLRSECRGELGLAAHGIELQPQPHRIGMPAARGPGGSRPDAGQHLERKNVGHAVERCGRKRRERDGHCFGEVGVSSNALDAQSLACCHEGPVLVRLDAQIEVRSDVVAVLQAEPHLRGAERA